MRSSISAMRIRRNADLRAAAYSGSARIRADCETAPAGCDRQKAPTVNLGDRAKTGEDGTVLLIRDTIETPGDRVREGEIDLFRVEAQLLHEQQLEYLLHIDDATSGPTSNST